MIGLKALKERARLMARRIECNGRERPVRSEAASVGARTLIDEQVSAIINLVVVLRPDEALFPKRTFDFMRAIKNDAPRERANIIERRDSPFELD